MIGIAITKIMEDAANAIGIVEWKIVITFAIEEHPDAIVNYIISWKRALSKILIDSK